MKKLIAITILSLSLSTAAYIPAFAGMSNSVSESFEDALPEIDVEVEKPEVDTPDETEAEKKEETEAPAESKEEISKETEPEIKESEAESHEETKAEESKEVPVREVVVREDNDNTPEKSSRVIYAHRSVVICDNEPIMTEEETTAEETTAEETISETVETEEEIEYVPETEFHKVPTTSSSLPKTADFSDIIFAGVAVLVVVAAAVAVVANRRKANANV